MAGVYNTELLPITGRLMHPINGTQFYMSVRYDITKVNVEKRIATVKFSPMGMYKATTNQDSKWYWGLYFGYPNTSGYSSLVVTQTYPLDITSTYEFGATKEDGSTNIQGCYGQLDDWSVTGNPNLAGLIGDEEYPDYTFMANYKAANGNIMDYYYGSEIPDDLALIVEMPYDQDGIFKFNVNITPSSGALYMEEESVTIWGANGTSLTQVVDLTVPSRLVMNNDYLGNVADITIVNDGTDDASAYQHTITYEFGSLTGTIIENTELTDIQWSIPLSDFLAEFPEDKTYMSVTLTCQTYKADGTYVGSSNITRYLFQDVDGDGVNVIMTAVDTDERVVAATLDNTQFVRYVTDPHIEIDIIAHKEVGSVYLETNGIQTLLISSNEINEENYPGGIPNVYKTSFSLDNIEFGTFTGIAYNADGTQTITTLEKELVPYTKLSLNPHGIIFQTNGIVKFTVEGNFFNKQFGSNGLANELHIYYRYCQVNENVIDNAEWIELTGATITEYDNYKIEAQQPGLDIQNRYEFQFKVTDLVMDVVTDAIRVVGKPVFDWNGRDFHMGVPFYLDEEIYMDVDEGIYGNDGDGNYRQALTPRDGAGNTVLGYGNYNEESGSTMIYGNGINLFSHNAMTLNGNNIWGSWTPMSNACTSPDVATGSYLRLGDICIISFYYQGTLTKTTENGTYLYFANLPFTPDSSLRWQGGGGNCSGYTASAPFACWNIEGEYIYGRTQTTSASGYINGTSGNTFYASGTIMYKIAEY